MFVIRFGCAVDAYYIFKNRVIGRVMEEEEDSNEGAHVNEKRECVCV